MALAGKVILITGASNGIGKAMVEHVAADGASVVINYNSESIAADYIAQAIGADRALAVQADVSKIPDIEKLVDAAVAKFGQIDIIIANAGMMPMHSIQNVTEEIYEKTFALNVKGPMFLTQKAVPHMKDGGRVIFVSTGMAHFSLVTPSYMLYAASKGAIEQITRITSKELAAKGITVNAIAPGPTGTELFYRGKSQSLIDGIKAQHPFKRIGEPEDIAKVIGFLCSEDSAWLNGQTLLANGGTMV